MSIEGKHAYRFGFLRSEKWKSVRLEALVREKGKCQICGEESISNDAHHIWYPEKIEDTEERHLVILCRTCHDFVHAMLPDCKTNDEEYGINQWKNLRNAILTWRISKSFLFDPESLKTISTRSLGIAYDKLRKETDQLRQIVAESSNLQVMKKKESIAVIEIVKQWSEFYYKHNPLDE